jgi:hypothetical protein
MLLYLLSSIVWYQIYILGPCGNTKKQHFEASTFMKTAVINQCLGYVENVLIGSETARMKFEHCLNLYAGQAIQNHSIRYM